MALIKCRECGKEISDKAESCPNCGYRIHKKESKSNTMKTGSIISLVACSILLCIVFLLYSYSAIPKQYDNDTKSSINVNLDTAKDNPNAIIFFYGVIVFTFIDFILTILFLTKKLKNIKIYKISLLVSSILALFLFVMYAQVIMCCEYILILSPLTNVVGAIIVFVSKEKKNELKTNN